MLDSTSAMQTSFLMKIWNESLMQVMQKVSGATRLRDERLRCDQWPGADEEWLVEGSLENASE